jgi:hypothetical protein
MSDFALNLHKRLTDERHVSDTTASAYIKTLTILNDKKPFKNLAFLKKYDAIDTFMATYSDNTKKTIYASIASVLLLFKDTSTYKSAYKHYVAKMKVLADESKKVDTSVKTEKQKENWIEWEEVKKVHTELSDKVFGNKDKVFGENAFAELLKLVVLSLYTDLPPRRNQDYLKMKVANIKDEDTLPTDYNYLIVDKKVPVKFVFNIYKTAKTYGKQTLLIPESLAKVLSLYFKQHPILKSVKGNTKVFPIAPFLLSFGSTDPVVADNFITRILNKIFDKKIGCSMLRHIYLSGKQNVNEMIADANAMGHSLSQQREYLKASPPPPPSSPTPSPSAPPTVVPVATLMTAQTPAEPPVSPPQTV